MYNLTKNVNAALKSISVTRKVHTEKHEVLIVGAGSGGCTIASKIKVFKKIAIIEPQLNHYYQPLFTLIGAGAKKLSDSVRPMQSAIPQNVQWYHDAVCDFSPDDNLVKLKSGKVISYNYLIIAMGLQLNFDQIPGLIKSLDNPDSGVCSNYSINYVEKTFETLKSFRSGNAIFTFPNTPIKCPGAPQKICYLVEDYLKKKNLRDKASLTYCTSLPVIFGVKKYADALWEVARSRNIDVKLRTNLIEIKPEERVALFQNLDKPDQITEMPYEMLHVTPPMSAPDVLKNNKNLVNEMGFLNVDHSTLQHVRYPNIFGIGDCSATPNPKTAASIAVQSKVLNDNLKSYAIGQPLNSIYNGYASCPLVTSYTKCILAEFDYKMEPLETFPFNQAKESELMYFLKAEILPFIYWNMMLKGKWSGPSFLRNLMHFNHKL